MEKFDFKISLYFEVERNKANTDNLNSGWVISTENDITELGYYIAKRLVKYGFCSAWIEYGDKQRHLYISTFKGIRFLLLTLKNLYHYGKI